MRLLILCLGYREVFEVCTNRSAETSSERNLAAIASTAPVAKPALQLDLLLQPCGVRLDHTPRREIRAVQAIPVFLQRETYLT